MISKPIVSIILLNWNGWSDTLDCLASLKLALRDGVDLRIVVIDNGSTDESVSILSKRPEIELIKSSVNRGFAAGNNIGIQHSLEAGSEFIGLLNNDTQVDPEFLIQLLRTFEQLPSVGIVSPKILYSKPQNRIWYAGGKFRNPRIIGEMIGLGQTDIGQYEAQQSVDFAVGCCMMIRNTVFDKIGFLDERFFFYHEDVDFSIRAIASGFDIIYQPNSVIFHKVASSTMHDPSISMHYEGESRIVFFFKYINGVTWASVITLEFLRMLRIVLRSILFGRFTYAVTYIRGLLSGFQRNYSISGRQEI